MQGPLLSVAHSLTPLDWAVLALPLIPQVTLLPLSLSVLFGWAPSARADSSVAQDSQPQRLWLEPKPRRT